jgi:nucleotide-binding universal stress UspA family protein
MEWGRILVPLAGSDSDAATLKAAADIASRFEAELAAAFSPADPAEMSPWLGEGFVGGVQVAAVESLRQAAMEGERKARTAFDAVAYGRKTFTALSSPVWRGLSLEARLADLIVFDDAAARGRGPFAEAFEQVLMEERAAILVDRGTDPFGTAMVMWNGSEPASRAARRAAPLLRRAARVVIAGVATDRPADLGRLQEYYHCRGIASEVMSLPKTGDVANCLFKAAEDISAGLLVSGAFGSGRLREFVFGGVTRDVLNSERPSLFLAH